MNRGTTSDPYLLFRSGSCVGALVLRDVREVMRPLPVEPMRGAPPFVMGVALVRGTPAPVLDAGRLLAATAAPAGTAPRRFIALKLGSRSACLAVDAVLDVRRVPRDRLDDTPPLLRAADDTVAPLLGTLDRDLLMVLDAARLVPDAVWTSLASTGERP